MVTIYDELWNFFLAEKYGNKSLAAKLIRDIDFVAIYFEGTTLILKIRRPGLLIGLRGFRIDALKNHLQVNISTIEEKERSIADSIISRGVFEDYYF